MDLRKYLYLFILLIIIMQLWSGLWGYHWSRWRCRHVHWMMCLCTPFSHLILHIFYFILYLLFFAGPLVLMILSLS